MEQTRYIDDTEVSVFWSTDLDREDIIREPLAEVLDLGLRTRRKTHLDSSLTYVS